MLEPPIPINESVRIKSLHELNILDTPPEARFDRITKIAKILFDVPIAIVSLIDVNRQWFKSCIGLDERETPRGISFCGHAILENDILIVEDAKNDERFLDNPLVTGPPYIRFYAGRPIKGPNNNNLGTLCIIDMYPRKLSKADKSVLNDLAIWVENEFKNIKLTNELKIMTEQLQKVEKILLEKNITLEKQIEEKSIELIKKEKMVLVGTMASRIAHDLKNPLTNIMLISDLLSQQLEDKMDDQMKSKCKTLKKSISNMSMIIGDVLDFVRTSNLNVTKNSVKKLLENVVNNINADNSVNIILPTNDLTISCDGRKLEAVFANLIMNSIQAIYNSGHIEIGIKESSNNAVIDIQDSGPGIPEDVLQKIFEPLFTTKTHGTGLGLGICKSIIKQHGGTISVKNNPTVFTITLPIHQKINQIF